jgi:hypothetical protein
VVYFKVTFRIFIAQNVSTLRVIQQEEKVSADETLGIIPKEASVLYLQSPFQVTFMVAPCILQSLINYLSPTNAIILNLFNLKY